jgi:hypothetical protein
MKTNLGTRLRMVTLIAAALAFCAPVWSDVRILGGSSSAERMCYCDCDATPGSKMCMHMCELAKYENRSWATSCHKAAESEPEQPSSTPGAHSTKDNSEQQARR